MAKDHRSRALEVYHAALAREDAERNNFLARACDGEDELRRSVEAMLAATPPTGFLKTSSDDRPVPAGYQLGDYVVAERIGAGAMGDVYRGRDTRLKRDVAIKVLPAAYTHEPERLARFEREARLLAALDHPHIAAIHGVEEHNGIRALILALVPGETLAARIAHRPLPLGDALKYARQIADALEAAHDKGIVHRDLKPANIKVTPAGDIKVLDFGLATGAPLFTEPIDEGSSEEPAHRTREGMLLGTAVYMSPEQAAGRPVDRRADVWAFGCVLFEMLTGRRAFPGDSTAEVLGAVMHAAPDWNLLPRSVPGLVHRLLRRCLEKDLDWRLPHLGVARLEIEDAFQPEAVVFPPRKRFVATSIALAVVAVTASAALITWFARSRGPAAATAPIVRFSESLGQRFGPGPGNLPQVAVSPDGTHLVYGSADGLYLRSMPDLDARLIPGTAGAASNPVFAPDGQSVAFFSGSMAEGGSINIVPVEGGTATSLATLDFPPYGMSWAPDGILFGRSFGKGAKGIVRVPLTGGREEQIIRTGEEFVHGPQLLPDGRTVVFTLASGVSPERWDRARIVAHSLATGATRTLVDGGADPRYLPSGHLLYARGDVLFAVRFDAERLEVTGMAVPVAQGVLRANPSVSGAAHFAVSPAGVLAFVEASPRLYELALIDRNAVARTLSFPPAVYQYPRLSPDGTRLAVGVASGGGSEIWVSQGEGTDALRRLTFEGRNRFPVWSADGARVTFQSDRDGDEALFWQRADGAEPAKRLTTAAPGASHQPQSWSPDGQHLLFEVASGAEFSLWSYSAKTGESSQVGSVASAIPPNAVFSPDGRWIAYSTREADKFFVSVQPFPPTGTKYQVAEGGIFPAWSRDGREMFYFHGASILSAVSIRQQPVFAAGRPRDLWRQRAGTMMMGAGSVPRRGFDTTPDGSFLALTAAKGDASNSGSRLQVVLNWLDELKRRVPPR